MVRPHGAQVTDPVRAIGRYDRDGSGGGGSLPSRYSDDSTGLCFNFAMPMPNDKRPRTAVAVGKITEKSVPKVK
jgi:hypothetical protein